jgi:hypothetical protein
MRAPVSKDELRNNFYHLDEGSIRDIAEEYGLSYYLGLADSQLPFEPVYQDDNVILYAID